MIPEENLQAAINEEVKGTGSPAMFARRLERNFRNLNRRLTTVEGQARGTSWTPTWTNLTVGDGTTEQSTWVRIGNTIFFTLFVTFGSTSSISGAPSFSLPAAAANAFTVNALYYDDSATTYYEGRCTGFASAAALAVSNSSSTYLTTTVLSSTVPFTWATDDLIVAHGFYIAA